MKPINFIPVLIIALIFLASCGPTPRQAVKYNKKIVSLQKNVVEATDYMEEAFNTFDTVKIKKALINAKKVNRRSLKTLKTKIKYLGRKSFFYGNAVVDSSLFVGMKNYLNQLNLSYEKEYYQMYKLYCLPDEKYDEAEFKEYRDKKDIRLKTAFNNFVEVQNAFANRYLIELNKKK